MKAQVKSVAVSLVDGFRKLVRFAGESLSDLTQGERLDWELWAMSFAAGPGVLTTASRSHPRPGSPFPELAKAQAELSAGIRALRRGDSWRVPMPDARVIMPTKTGLLNSYMGSELATFLGRAADLLSAYWGLVRPCARCGRVFARRGRREYCSTECSEKASRESQKARWRKFQPKRRRNYADEYVKRIAKKTGQKNIRRRGRGRREGR